MRKMKKALATVLAATMVMGMSSTAWATTPTTETEFKFKKTYETSNGATPATFPKETLSFTVSPKEGNPDNTKMISVADHTVDSNPDENIIVTIPEYEKVGKYNYTVSEVPGNTQGVTYSNNTFDVQVLAFYETDATTQERKIKTQVAFTKKDANNLKVDGIVNKYDLGTLTVDKNVSGNLASDTEKFAIDVVFTSNKPVHSAIDGVTRWTEENGVYTSNTVTFNIAHGDDVSTIANIPVGVSYTVVEQSKHTEKDANGSDASKGYTATYENANGTIEADKTSAAVVLNTKGTEVDTGITLDSLPYIMILAVAALGMVGFVAKKRKEDEMF